MKYITWTIEHLAVVLALACLAMSFMAPYAPAGTQIAVIAVFLLLFAAYLRFSRWEKREFGNSENPPL